MESRLKIVSYNILYDMPGLAHHWKWAQRREMIGELITHLKPDLIGLQEVTLPMYSALREMLPDYGAAGFVADPGEKRAWIMNPVLYLRERFSLEREGFFWLAGIKKGGLPSKCWRGLDTSLRRFRYAVRVELALKDTKQRLYYLNTHFPVGESVLREKAVEKLVEGLGDLDESQPAVLTGDFNAEAEEVLSPLFEKGFRDARRECEEGPLGPSGTKVSRETLDVGERAIDQVFVRNISRVINFRTVDYTCGSQHPSDHLPVQGIIAIE